MFFNCFFEKTVRTLKIGETAIFSIILEDFYNHFISKQF